jgi:hypothetical protein
LAAPRHGQQRQSVSKVTACGGLAGFNRGGASPAVLELEGRIAKLRDTVQRYAKDCAPYRHPQLQAIAHKHLSADGAPICPVRLKVTFTTWRMMPASRQEAESHAILTAGGDLVAYAPQSPSSAYPSCGQDRS